MELQAKWIWVKRHSNTPNCYIYARRQFEIESAPEASLLVTCCAHYELYVNGRYVGRGPVRKMDGRQFVDRHEIRRYLRPGPNVIGAICHHPNPGTDAQAGFSAQLNTSTDDDPVLLTDENWRVLLAGDWSSCSTEAGPGVVYDSRLKPVGWNVVGFNDSEWEHPEILVDAHTELLERPIRSLMETDCAPVDIVRWESDADNSLQNSRRIRGIRNLLRPGSGVTIIEPAGHASITLDFGRELTGYAGFHVADSGGAVLEVSYLDVSERDAVVQPDVDRVILRGGMQKWQAFGRRTFRYMRLTFRDFSRPIALMEVCVRAISYPTKQHWTFECSDELINDIHKLCVNTLSLCMQDCYEPDPPGDQSPKPSESRIQALVNYHTFADPDLAASDLRRFALQLGSLPSTQVLSWILMLHEYYLHIGDRLIVDDLYDSLRQAIVGMLLTQSSDTTAAWNALAYQSLRDASKLALALSNYDDAQSWHERAQRILDTFNARFWSDSVTSYTSTGNELIADHEANVLAVCCGLVSSQRGGELHEAIRNAAVNLGPGLGYYSLGAMAALDLVPEALDLIREEWGRMLASGTLLTPKRLSDGPDAHCVGLSNARCVAPAAFLAAEVLGIRPSSPDSPVAIVRPNSGGLAWAKGGYDLPTGSLRVEWSNDESEFRLEIESQDGFSVAVPVGMFRVPVIREIDLTPETPERLARKTYGWGDVVWRGDEERDPYLDWLDSQEEAPPGHYQPKMRCELQGSYVWIRQPVSTHVRYLVHED